MTVLEQKGHIERQDESLRSCANVHITQFDDTRYMILVGVAKDGLGAFDVAVISFHFYQRTFVVVSGDEVNLQPRILAEIIELAIHFAEDVGHEIFEDGTLVSIEIASQDVGRSALFEHADEKARVCHIHLELVGDGVAVEGEFGRKRL